MPPDIFARRRNEGLLFLGVLAALAVGSSLLTGFDAGKGLGSVVRAAVWGATNFHPDAASLSKLPEIARKLWETVLMAVASTSVAAVFATLLALAGSRATRPHVLAGVAVRGVASVLRNIPLVAWAMILMLAFGQSLLTGYLTLFVGSLGFLTRAFLETMDEAGEHAVEALRATGAGYACIVTQAVLPASLPQMISWVLFMIDTNIRDATLVGLLTGTGIGFLFDLYYKTFEFHDASLVVLLVVATVIAVEAVSNAARRVIL